MYTEAGAHLKFFVPNIALAENAAEVLKEIDIGASSADHGEYLCVRPCRVRRLQFTLTGEVAGGTSVAPQVVVTKRPTPKSATGASAVGTLNVPDGTAVGKTVYKDIEPVDFAVGDSMHVAHVIGTGTPTGMGHFSAICDDKPEEAANNSDMVESA